jgi:hypothetical protein
MNVKKIHVEVFYVLTPFGFAVNTPRRHNSEDLGLIL